MAERPLLEERQTQKFAYGIERPFSHSQAFPNPRALVSALFQPFMQNSFGSFNPFFCLRSCFFL